MNLYSTVELNSSFDTVRIGISFTSKIDFQKLSFLLIDLETPYIEN